MSGEKAMRIAELNDQFRTALGICCGIPGMVVMTRGIAEIDGAVKVRILQAVRSFSNFTQDNDPYGEHDFGCVEVSGAGKTFWKIDYYADDQLEFGSDAPENPQRCFRVMTIMLAEEY